MSDNLYAGRLICVLDEMARLLSDNRSLQAKLNERTAVMIDGKKLIETLTCERDQYQRLYQDMKARYHHAVDQADLFQKKYKAASAKNTKNRRTT